jgi:hypothetical protein
VAILDEWSANRKLPPESGWRVNFWCALLR